MFYNPKRQNINYLLRDALEDIIQAISLLELLYKDKSENESILYQTATPELNDLVELPTKDIKQLLTPSRTVLLKPSTVSQGL